MSILSQRLKVSKEMLKWIKCN